MKKTYFNPAHLWFIDRNTGKSYRARRSLRFGSACFKTDASDGNEDEEEKKKLLLEVRAAAKKEIESSKLQLDFNKLSEDWSKLPLEAVRALCDKETGVLARFAKMDAKIVELETASRGNNPERPLSLRQQISKWADENKDAITKIRNKTKAELTPMVLELRQTGQTTAEPQPLVVSSPMLPSNTYGSTTYLPPITWEPGINDIPRQAPTFWDYIPKGATDSPAFGWVNKTNVQGAAGFLAPGQLKPNLSFQITTAISTYRKVAVTDKVAQELLWDIPGFETLVKDEIRYQILIACNTAVLTGVGSSTSPTGIKNLSVAFTTTGLKAPNPNYYDALRAVVAQMRKGFITGDITIAINPIDSANMDMAKATSSGVYIMPPFSTQNGKNIAGATIIEDNGIPVGYFQAAFLRYYRILIYKPLILTFGWENDDFTKNLITYLGELAFHQFFNTQYTGAFVYDSFANVIAAIT